MPPSKLKPLTKAVSLVSVAVLAAVVRAEDVRVGGARTFGLAGAGIALPLDFYETHVLNPALLGLSGRKFRLGLPYVGYHTDRISLRQVGDLIKNVDSGGVSDDQVVKLARKYGEDTKELGVSGGIGLSWDEFAFSGSVEAVVRSVPNASLRNFLATDDDNYQDTPIDSRLDAYGLGYYETDTSYGHALSLKGGTMLSLGATARVVSAFYAHKIADASAIAGNGGVRNGSEISSNDDAIERSSFGIDLGGVGSVRAAPNAYFGFNVRNLVEPNVTFVRTMPNTDFPLRRDLRPFKREIGVGASYVRSHCLFALDAVDLGNHAGAAGLRFGAEYSVNKHFAIRGGYDSRSNFVGGICVGGVNAAISANGTTSIVAAIRF